MERQEEKQELSMKAKEWLRLHRLEGVERNVREAFGHIEFQTRSSREGYYTLNVVYLGNGSWGFHDVRGRDLRF